MRVGFIGAGGIAHRHLDVLSRFADVEVVALADPDLARAEAAAAPGGARAYAGAEAMLDAERLDAVWICTPPFAHGGAERAAITRGVPLLVEKPLAVDLEQAEAIGAEAAAAGIVTAVGYHWRYMDTVERARETLSQRPARLLTGYWLDSTPPVAWWGREAQSGGQVNEQATHIFDLARWLAGEVEEVYAAAARTRRAAHPDLDIDDVATATLKFRSGAVGTISSTCLLGWGHRIGLDLFGDDLVVEIGQGELGVYGALGTTEMHAGMDPVEAQDRAFLNAAAGGGNRIRCTYADALETQRLTAAVRRSARSGRPERPRPAGES